MATLAPNRNSLHEVLRRMYSELKRAQFKIRAAPKITLQTAQHHTAWWYMLHTSVNKTSALRPACRGVKIFL